MSATDEKDEEKLLEELDFEAQRERQFDELNEMLENRSMPSEEWKNGVGTALTAYAAGTGDWTAVKTAFVDGWAKEYAAAHAG